MTKCGRYGRDRSSFDYSPARIRASVDQSLARLRTGYLDTVYLHDVEFVCSPAIQKGGGDHLRALGEEKAGFGLAEGEEGRIRGEGDSAILGAIAELRKMQVEGLIKNVGITGEYMLLLLYLSYFLPTFLIPV
jgi:D-arabinose 1-dehydrogenase